jgi:polyphosphate kinase
MDTLLQVEDELRRRRFARTRCGSRRPSTRRSDVLEFVVTQLGLDESEVSTAGGARSSTQDLHELASLPRADLRETPWRPVVPRALAESRARLEMRTNEAAPRRFGHADSTIFERIREGDILLHHPYESFEASVERFISEAASTRTSRDQADDLPHEPRFTDRAQR